MNLLLCKFNEIDNFNFKHMLEYYQKYFIFKIIDNETFIYLDTKILKDYLKNGEEIKHRNYIFLYLKYQKNIDTNINLKKFYKFINVNNYVCLNKTNIKFKNIYNFYSKNIDYIYNKILRISNNKNNFNIKDPNIIKLDNSFYANIKNERFYFSKISNKNYKYKGIILNNNLNINNMILSILSISSLSKIKTNNSLYKSYFDMETQKKENLQFNTKCNLIITQKENIKLWQNILNKYYPEAIVSIFSKKKINNLKNKDILNTDFLIINSSLIKVGLNNQYQYQNLYQNNFNKNYDLIENSLYDFILNENLENNYFSNVFIFNWNNIIYDNFEKMINTDKNNLIYYLTCCLNKYYISNIDLTDDYLNYLIKSGIIINDYNPIFETYKNNLYLNNINLSQNIKQNTYPNTKQNNNSLCNKEYDRDSDFNIFYKIIKDELTIKSLQSSPDLINNILINLELSDYEKEIYSNLFDNNDKNKYDNISKYLIDIDKYNFKEEDFKNIINNNDKNSYFNNIISNYDENDKNNICSICIDKIENSNNFTILLCGHYFCKPCLRKYIIKNLDGTYCPVCRKEFEINDVLCPIINDSSKINSTKINKIFEIIDKEIEMTNLDDNNNLSLMIVSYLNENIDHLKNILKKYPPEFLIITKYENILKNKIDNIKAFIFIDFPNISEEFKMIQIHNIQNKILENYLIDNNSINDEYINDSLIKKNFYYLNMNMNINNFQ